MMWVLFVAWSRSRALAEIAIEMTRQVHRQAFILMGNT